MFWQNGSLDQTIANKLAWLFNVRAAAPPKDDSAYETSSAELGRCESCADASCDDGLECSSDVVVLCLPTCGKADECRGLESHLKMSKYKS
eukprot:5193107-Amphidinium_carterae.1